MLDRSGVQGHSKVPQNAHQHPARCQERQGIAGHKHVADPGVQARLPAALFGETLREALALVLLVQTSLPGSLHHQRQRQADGELRAGAGANDRGAMVCGIAQTNPGNGFGYLVVISRQAGG